MRWIASLVPLLLLIACTLATPTAPPATRLPSPSPTATSVSRSLPTPTPGAVPTAPPAAVAGSPVTGERATVRTVIDGDTLTVVTARGEAVVRLIGIDAPERGTDGRATECFYEEATQLLAELTPPGSLVLLERDVSDTDRYGRLLRYVWVERHGQWVLVNEELVTRGAAVAREYPPDTRYADRLAAAQQRARTSGAGLWGNCTAPLATPTPTLAPARQTGCDPSYPDICVPPPPPDLDCRDIPYRRFRVLPPDPHRFDSDRDGIGCESG